jgi:hypothetical protein
MSTPKTPLVSAVFVVTPLFLLAQNVVGQPGVVNRSVERLTLLPGPYLLSPARTTPTMLPSPLKLDAPAWHFVPAPPPSASARVGTLKLVDRASIESMPAGTATPRPTPATTRPSPESLHFDSTLESPRVPNTIQMKFIPAERK